MTITPTKLTRAAGVAAAPTTYVDWLGSQPL